MPGLVLEVLTGGEKRLRYRRKVKGKDIEITLADFPSVTIDKAREKAKRHALELVDDIDPNQVKREQREAANQATTIEQLY
ncbi:Arm DNA-binding domain-containing protein [Ferrimonas gelatinilytica]|uniref:Integrase DNA-binding domain-containing protein n=1 Tax=Ferrimonas gelatinilytica TaxID=1255257 RepID=A0ABP9RSK5_9GAMM